MHTGLHILPCSPQRKRSRYVTFITLQWRTYRPMIQHFTSMRSYRVFMLHHGRVRLCTWHWKLCHLSLPRKSYPMLPNWA
ncbi:hypothetical protein LB503_004879 [Fusarium chuoi]|nr:hypothetical protein LB503_004879 [Fusarium chuoi]